MRMESENPVAVNADIRILHQSAHHFFCPLCRPKLFPVIHITGNRQTVALCCAACRAAKRHGLTVSCDVNYRKKLWTAERAKEVMSGLMQYTDVCIDGDRIFGFHPHGMDFSQMPVNPSNYRNILRKMCEQFNLKYAISSLRVPKSASDNLWSACIYSMEKDEFYHSREYRFHPIVDRVGGGDSFVGGTICGLLDGKDIRGALEFGAAAAALKHTIPGDMNLVTREEVETLAGGDGTGAVQR